MLTGPNPKFTGPNPRDKKVHSIHNEVMARMKMLEWSGIGDNNVIFHIVVSILFKFKNSFGNKSLRSIKCFIF